MDSHSQSVDYDGSLKQHKSHFPCNVGRRAEDEIFILSLISIYLLLSSSCKSNRRNLQWCKGWNLFEILSFKSLRFLIKLRLVFWKEASLCLSTPIFFYWYFVNIWSPPFLIKAKSIYVYQSVIGSFCQALVHILFGQEKFGLSCVKLTHRAHFGDNVWGQLIWIYNFYFLSNCSMLSPL